MQRCHRRDRVRTCGGPFRSEVRQPQRHRILCAIADEGEVEPARVADVIGRAHVSRRTFYELFDDRLFSALHGVVAAAADSAGPAFCAHDGWTGRVRAGLNALLEFLHQQPRLVRLYIVGSGAPRQELFASRGEVIAHLAALLEDGRRPGSTDWELTPLAGEGL
jgi:AcrR family transcriptional regulator